MFCYVHIFIFLGNLIVIEIFLLCQVQYGRMLIPLLPSMLYYCIYSLIPTFNYKPPSPVGVIRESSNTEGQEMKALLREYDIDTGRGYPVQVKATDLFRESRRQNIGQLKQVVPSSGKSVPVNQKHSSAVVEEAKRTVTILLREVSHWL